MSALLLLVCAAAATAQDAGRLFEDLLGSYNKLARPVIKDDDQVKIQFKLKLLQILDVHEKKQIVATNGWLIHIWTDYRLQWNPASYGNVTVMHIPAELIWLPDIILYNNADGSPQVTTLTKAHVYFSGKIVWEPPVIYKSMCEISIEWFPLDEQFCKMKFGSWTYYGSQLDMLHLETDAVVEMEEEGERVWTVALGIDIAEFQESVEWDLMSVVGTRHAKWYPCCDYPYVDITYFINIRRKTLFYTVNLIVPCVGITFLTCLVFYLPSDSNNKISLSVSVLVSLTVFFLLLTAAAQIEIIPPTSLVVPLIGRYLLFTMVLVSCSVCITVFIVNVHYRSGNVFPIPSWVRVAFLQWAPVLLCMPKPQRRYDEDRIDTARSKFTSHLSVSRESALFRRGSDVAQRRLEEATLQAFANISYIAAQMRDKELDENLKDDWKYVAMVLDRVFFGIFSTVIFVGTAGLILSAPIVWDTRIPVTQLLKAAMEAAGQ